MRRFFCYIILLFLTAQTAFVAADVHSVHQEHSIETHHHAPAENTLHELNADAAGQPVGDPSTHHNPNQTADCIHCCHCHGHFSKVAANPIEAAPAALSAFTAWAYLSAYQPVRTAPKLRPPIA